MKASSHHLRRRRHGAPRERTLRRSLYASVAIVATVYIAVIIGSQMLVSDHDIIHKKEVAFVAVALAALGIELAV